MSSAAAAANQAFGIDRGLPFPLTDLDDAEVVLLVGGNPAETMPPFMQHLRQRGGALVVVDPRRTANRAARRRCTCSPRRARTWRWRWASCTRGRRRAPAPRLRPRADQRVGRRRPDRRGVVARARRTRHRRRRGRPAPGGRAARRALAALMCSPRRGAEQHASGTDDGAGVASTWRSRWACRARPAPATGCLTGQGNGQGGREHGQKADQLPGYRRIDDPAARAHVAGVWGVDPDSLPGPGRSRLRAAGRARHAGRAAGADGVRQQPGRVRAARRPRRRPAVQCLDFLVVADFVLSETAAWRTWSCRSTQWAEEDGTMTNLEGRVLLRGQARSSRRKASAATSTCCTGSPQRLGVARRSRRSGGGVRRAAAGLAPAASPTTPASPTSGSRAGRACTGPCPAGRHPGTPRLFLDRFAHAGRPGAVPRPSSTAAPPSPGRGVPAAT